MTDSNDENETYQKSDENEKVFLQFDFVKLHHCMPVDGNEFGEIVWEMTLSIRQCGKTNIKNAEC